MMIVFAFAGYGLGVASIRGQSPEWAIFLVIMVAILVALDREIKSHEC
jgi:hypothetical protein